MSNECKMIGDFDVATSETFVKFLVFVATFPLSEGDF